MIWHINSYNWLGTPYHLFLPIMTHKSVINVHCYCQEWVLQTEVNVVPLIAYWLLHDFNGQLNPTLRTLGLDLHWGHFFLLPQAVETLLVYSEVEMRLPYHGLEYVLEMVA